MKRPARSIELVVSSLAFSDSPFKFKEVLWGSVLRMRASMHMLMYDLQKHGSGRVRTILIDELHAPAIFVLRSPVIFPAAVRKNHFTVYQIPANARRQDGDVIPKKKKEAKKKTPALRLRLRRESDHSRRRRSVGENLTYKLKANAKPKAKSRKQMQSRKPKAESLKTLIMRR